MTPFIHENFLLNNKTAERLFHKYSENQPIIDFHCHLSPALIADDHRFENITQGWLYGDHYKWRAMRTNGISEKYCTGAATDYEKFEKWAETVPATVGNPLYHWTHLELARYFNITKLLSPGSAKKIYDEASLQLIDTEHSVKSLLRKMRVSTVCTTDDPVDSLEHHIKLKSANDFRVLPTFRPDNILKTEDPRTFSVYVSKLESSSGISINNTDSLLSAIDSRHGFFHEMGCRVSDHGLDRFYYEAASTSEIDIILNKLLKGESVSEIENEKFRSFVLLAICEMNHERGWVQQFHVGAQRNNNLRMFRQLGPDTGWDSIGRPQDPFKMARFLSELDNKEKLTRTILYNLNPADNEMMITMAGNFNDGSSVCKVQYGAAWWFLDQKNGMEKHLRDLASLGLLRRFIGMVTDSRSFLSYPRHEYFRRLVCNFIGEEVEKGLIPDEDELLGPLIEGVSYKNAKEYFGF
jgi:glucuronate isomerase